MSSSAMKNFTLKFRRKKRGVAGGEEGSSADQTDLNNNNQPTGEVSGIDDDELIVQEEDARNDKTQTYTGEELDKIERLEEADKVDMDEVKPFLVSNIYNSINQIDQKITSKFENWMAVK
jgi:hypothetical protein